MLITLIRDDDGWDVAVQKAILSFIGTLVYRPLDEREHPDQPVLASSVMPPNTFSIGLNDSIFAAPKVSLKSVFFYCLLLSGIGRRFETRLRPFSALLFSAVVA